MTNDAEKTRTVSLKEIAAIRPGYPFRGTIREVPDGDAAVVQIKNADPASGVQWDELLRTELPGRKEPDWLCAGDVLFLARGARNQAIALDDPPDNTVCAPQFFVVRLHDPREALPGYVAWFINQVCGQQYQAKSAQGSLVTSIPRQVLEDMPIPLTALKRQRRIIALDRAAQKEREVFAKMMDNREKQIAFVARDLMK